MPFLFLYNYVHGTEVLNNVSELLGHQIKRGGLISDYLELELFNLQFIILFMYSTRLHAGGGMVFQATYSKWDSFAAMSRGKSNK